MNNFEIISLILYLFLFVSMMVIIFFGIDFLRNKKASQSETIRIITPLRLQAYERIILYLERISPQDIATRLLNPVLTAREFQNTIIQSINEEFNHNYTQQLYVSDETWKKVLLVKENVIRSVKIAFATLPEKATASDLASRLLEDKEQQVQKEITQAIAYLKKEAQSLF